MATELIACCGLSCSDCEAYQATQANDPARVEEVAAKWRTEYHNPGITAQGVWCDGCITEGRKCFHCAECNIRACAALHGVENCAHCAEYGCEKITAFLGFVPEAKARLDAIHASLGHA